MTEILANDTKTIISQYIKVSSQYIVHLKADLFLETMETRRKWNDIFKMLKETKAVN